MQHFHSEPHPEPQSVYTNPNASPLNTNSPIDSLDTAEQRRLQESIEDYLDRVCHPLMDTLPYAARQELRQEIAQHLHALVQAYRESGYAPALATEKALDKFGPPHLVAQKWNPVTAREGQYRRMERWFAGQWQGIAATLVLCGAAGLLGLVWRHPGMVSPHGLMSRSHPPVVAVSTPAAVPSPLSVASTADEAVFRAELTAQMAALNQARAELMAAQAQLAEHLAAMQQSDASFARAQADFAITSAAGKDTLRLQAEMQMQQDALQQRRMLVKQIQQIVRQRQAAVAAETSQMEAIRSQRVHRGL